MTLRRWDRLVVEARTRPELEQLIRQHARAGWVVERELTLNDRPSALRLCVVLRKEVPGARPFGYRGRD
jgi:hypothetical protein